jgi:hypothetical protein
MQKAFKEQDKRLHNVLVTLTPSDSQLRDTLLKHSSKTAAHLIEKMNFQRLWITEGIFDLAFANKFEELTPVARLVVQAKSYVSYKTLVANKLIHQDEAKLWFGYFKTNREQLMLLQQSDITHLKLSFERTEKRPA